MRKIGTVDIFMDDDGNGSSRSRFDRYTKRGEVVLVPRNDHYPIRGKEDLADIFAHELGHIIGNVLELPAQMNASFDNFLANLTGITSPTLYKSEEAAWELAGKMRKINPKNRDPRLKSYLEE